MIKFINRQLKNKKGFTLVELIVVIAILGVLAAIAVPKLGGFRESAARKADVATARTIATAVAAGIADGVIEIPDSGSYDVDEDDIEDYLDGGLPTPQENGAGDSFEIKVSDEGDITIETGHGVIYPLADDYGSDEESEDEEES